MISIVKTALSTTTRSITLVYANRSADSVIFADDLERLQAGVGRPADRAPPPRLGARLPRRGAVRRVGGRPRARRLLRLWSRCRTWTWSRPVSQRSASTLRRLFIERFETPAVEVDDAASEGRAHDGVARRSASTAASTRCGYEAGDTILEAARRGGLQPPFSCEAGNCATCMAHLDEGSATMRVNNALSAEEVDDGWVLTCQAIPTSAEVVVNYDG